VQRTVNAGAAPAKGNQHRNAILMVMVLGAFVAILNQTLLNVAIPHMMADFNVTADQVQWLTTAYMMTNGILIPISAFLIGTFTTRQLFITAMSLFALGSLICSVAPVFSVIVLGRVIQALGGGVIMPLMMTVVLDLFPVEARGRAMGTIAIAMFFAPAVGPTLSGWMVEHWSWRWLFWVVIPIAVIDIILAVVMLRNVTSRIRPSFDLWGFITSVVGFGALLYGFSEAGSKGWHNSTVESSIAVGVVFIILFVLREITAREPMLDLSVFRYSMFSLTTIIGCLVNIAMFGAMILTPIYLQNLRGYTPLESGLLMLPGAVLMGIMSPIAGALFDKIGARPLAVIGLLITVVTTWQFTKLSATTPYMHVMMLYTARMFGMSFLVMSIQTAGLNQLPRYLNAHGTAASNTARTVASSLGTAYMVTVMTNRTRVHLADYSNLMTVGQPWLYQHVQMLGQGLAMKLGLPPSAWPHAVAPVLYGLVEKQATIEGIDDSFVIATGLTVVALVLSFFIRRVVPARTAEPVRALPEPKPQLQPAER
jgi:EmrB/QacA subfamily drug resistance transporter